MKSRIFNLKALFLGGLIAAAQLCYAQKASGSDDSTKEYSKQMKQLQEQMRDLQKHMSKLQTEEFKRNSESFRKQSAEMSKLQAEDFKKNAEKFKLQSEDMRKMALDMAAQARTFAYNATKELKFNVEGMTPPVPPSPATAPKAPKAPLFNFSYSDKDLAKQIQSGEVIEKIKNYSKSYSVDGDDKLQISNKYGKVIVNTWSKNEIKVDIQIKADANEADEAQKLLDGVSIEDRKENSLASFVTNIGSKNYSSSSSNWFGMSRTRVRKVEVNYTIYMPAKNQLQISNNYGAIQLPNAMYGKVVLNNGYGNLIAKSLQNPTNEVNVRYGDVNIENYKGSELNISYGDLILGEADKLNAKVSYSSAKIGTLTTSGVIIVRYGDGFKIAGLDKNLKNLSITSAYSDVRLGVNTYENADFDVTVSHGSFNYGSRPVSLVAKTPADSERRYSSTFTYKGSLGKGNSEKLITIRSTYGDIKFD